MKRLLGWEHRLQGAFDAARGRTFEWGEFDCALFACDCVNAITGVDLGAPYRGKYKTEVEAVALIGGDVGMFALGVASLAGLRPILPTLAAAGDVVVLENGIPSRALGVVAHAGNFAWCASEHGLVRAGMSTWRLAWRIE